MDRSVWPLAAFFFAAGVLSTTIVYQTFGVFAAPQALIKTTEPSRLPSSFDNARQAIIRQLKDPSSVQFGKIFEGRGIIGKSTVCGQVNAKNGFGGYTGMTGFVYFPNEDRAEMITDPVNSGMTHDGITAYYKDCVGL